MPNHAEKFTDNFAQCVEHLHTDLQSLRTGRASPAVVEPLMVQAYGTSTPLVQVASVTAPEPTQLVIQPWDPSIIKDIAKSIQASPLGIMPSIDGHIIRLQFPPLTEERRKEMTKVVKEKEEGAHVAIRNVREAAHKQIKQMEKDGEISEDQAELEKQHLQKMVDDFNEKIKEISDSKVKELLAI
jgi:ribosome recycling factor